MSVDCICVNGCGATRRHRCGTCLERWQGYRGARPGAGSLLVGTLSVGLDLWKLRHYEGVRAAADCCAVLSEPDQLARGRVWLSVQ